MESNIYRTFELANFLRNSEKYEKSIELYSSILLKIEKEHKLYPKVLDRRGIAYERIKNWELAEKELINSLKLSPNDAHAMNYLAYSWVERGDNINQALGMLKKANNLKKNNGYITDSLG
jgi:tetratricopeptide (TPR) repeat protein